jgi:hypothetical protein
MSACKHGEPLLRCLECEGEIAEKNTAALAQSQARKEDHYFVFCAYCHARGPVMCDAITAIRYWNDLEGRR